MEVSPGAENTKGPKEIDGLTSKEEISNSGRGRHAAANSLDGPRGLGPRTLVPTLDACTRGSGMTSPCEIQEHDVDPGRNGGGRGGDVGQGDALVEELASTMREKLLCTQSSSSIRRAEGAKASVATTQGRNQDACMFLKVTVVQGRALVGELANERTTYSTLQNFVVDLQFNGQRARTRNEVRCCVEPDFKDEAFAFVLREAHELPVNARGWTTFLEADLLLHVVLLKQRVHQQDHTPVFDSECFSVTGDPATNQWSTNGAIKREVVGSAEVDWRRALVPTSGTENGLHQAGGVFLAVELASTSPDSIVHPVGGILHVRLEVVAPREVSACPFKAADVTRAMTVRDSVRSEERRDFYLYAEAWWKSYTSVSKHLRKRSVKIFAEDERGQHRCVCSFLHPYRRGRLLPTPRHAARFVSLLPFQRRPSVGEQRAQSWNSPHAFLAAGRGDASDHALLLCSFLLGFGLDAFVCVGQVYSFDNAEREKGVSARQGSGNGCHGDEAKRGEETGHMWVCTFSGVRSEKKAFFWETLTGQRFSMFEPRSQQGVRLHKKAAKLVAVSPNHFSRVACMFSHREFFANKQVDDRIGHTSLDLSDTKLWKPMDSSRIAPLADATTSSSNRDNVQADIVLCRPSLNAEVVTERIELEVKRRIVEWREGQALSTVWDDGLAFLLGPAIFAYEQERVSGVSSGGDDFQDAVQGAVPERHCFKGYPTCFDHCSSGKMMASLLANVVSRDILASIGDHLRFAVRSMVFPYPDGVLAVWIMLACRFERASVS